MSEIEIKDTDTEEFKVVEGGATIDKPIRGLIKNNDATKVQQLDTLKTFDYAKALAEHVKGCGTPLTVGVQGEWGSGKTSLLNMMKEQIEEIDALPGQKGARAVLGKNIFKTIWINTWEHSLLKTPEECLLSIINEIIDTIAAVDGTWNSAQKAKSALSALAKAQFVLVQRQPLALKRDRSRTKSWDREKMMEIRLKFFDQHLKILSRQ